jgi:hypothetical protein
MASLTDNINFFQPTGFRVTIDRKNYGNIEFFSQSVQHPSVSLDAVPQPIPRITSIPQPGDALSFTDLSVIMLLDEDLNSYKEMYSWMVRLVQTNYKGPDARVTEGTPPSTADIIVTALTSHNNSNVQFKYYDCLPTSLGDISLESTTTETQLTVPITFRFSYFEIV